MRGNSSRELRLKGCESLVECAGFPPLQGRGNAGCPVRLRLREAKYEVVPWNAFRPLQMAGGVLFWFLSECTGFG